MVFYKHCFDPRLKREQSDGSRTSVTAAISARLRQQGYATGLLLAGTIRHSNPSPNTDFLAVFINIIRSSRKDFTHLLFTRSAVIDRPKS